MVRIEDVLRALPAGAGPVGLLSGDEFTDAVSAFDAALVRLTGPEVALLMCADHSNVDANAARAAEHFARLGARVWLLPLEHHPARAPAIPPFELCVLGGGDPSELLACLADGVVWSAILQRWRAGAGLAGASAGAMALGAHCLVAEPGASLPRRWVPGLGPLEGVGLAVHASTRPSEWLDDVTAGAPGPVVALDDRTGIVLAGASIFTLGEGAARILTRREGS